RRFTEGHRRTNGRSSGERGKLSRIGPIGDAMGIFQDVRDLLAVNKEILAELKKLSIGLQGIAVSINAVAKDIHQIATESSGNDALAADLKGHTDPLQAAID